MAGLAAGVVTEAQVNSQPRQPTKLNLKLTKPATWSYIWVSIAFFYLVVTFFGIMSIRRLAN